MSAPEPDHRRAVPGAAEAAPEGADTGAPPGPATARPPGGTAAPPALAVGEGGLAVLPGLARRVMEHSNLGNTVYAAICEALISGHFRPGDPVRIRDLAASVGTSATPVRDAVLRLVQDEALVMRSARDIRVPPMTVPVYAEIRDIRLQLEALAAATAAERARPAQVAELRALLADNEAAIRDGAFGQATAMNQRFHFALAVIAERPVLHGTLRRLWLRMGPLIAAVYHEGGRSMIDRHYDVVDALERRDPAAAAAAIRADITEGGTVILARLQAEAAGPPPVPDAPGRAGAADASDPPGRTDPARPAPPRAG